MTRYDDHYLIAKREILHFHAYSITYTPPGGAAVATVANRRDAGDRDDRRIREYDLDTDDVPTPVLNGAIADGGEVWQIDEINNPIGGLVTVIASIAQEHSHSG